MIACKEFKQRKVDICYIPSVADEELWHELRNDDLSLDHFIEDVDAEI